MRFSSRELKELAISAVVIGFSFAWIMRGNGSFISLFLVMMVSVGSAFILHELAHKLVAQRYGCWAEYRMWETGLIMAFFLAVSPLHVVFAAPGAVYITSYTISRRQNGLISAAGPATNLLLAMLFLPLRSLGGTLGMLGYFGFIINAWIALFNMIPFPPLDGSKVKSWSMQIWLLMALTAFFLLGLG
ncbi:MAG: site-2 protease family protein [Candidatus Hydrothermarchaeaceae archaeon]